MSHEQEIVASLSEVGCTAGGMVALAQELGWIGSEAKVIGLNAMVKAVNVGKDGLTLKVLAHAIRDLSETIEACTDSVEAIMTGMADEASGLAERGETAVRDHEQTGEQIIARIEGLLTTLDTYQDEIADGLASLLAGTARLRQRVAEIATQLRKMVNGVGLLLQLEVELTTIATSAATVANEAAGKSVRERSASRHYTMESERAVLARTLGRSAGTAAGEMSQGTEGAAVGGSIELF